jgi:hypothetical protein
MPEALRVDLLTPEGRAARNLIRDQDIHPERIGGFAMIKAIRILLAELDRIAPEPKPSNLPCPLCGGKDLRPWPWPSALGGPHLECLDCRCIAPAEKWNGRKAITSA